MHPERKILFPDIETDTRPDFGPTQVTSLEEVEIGKTYIRHLRPVIGHTRRLKPVFGDWKTEEFELVEEPNLHRAWPTVRVRVRDDNGEVVECTALLSSLGIVPDERGVWPRNMWTEDPSKK